MKKESETQDPNQKENVDLAEDNGVGPKKTTNSTETSGNSRQNLEGNNKSDFEPYFGKGQLMLYVDTSDELLDLEDSDEAEFSLQSDWGVASFDLKSNFWSFENLTKLTKISQNRKTNCSKVQKTNKNSEKMALEEPSTNNNDFNNPNTSIAQNIVQNLASNTFMFLDVSKSFQLNSQK